MSTVMSEKLKETLGIIEKVHEAAPLNLPAPIPIEEYEENPELSPPVPFEKRQIATTIPDIENSDLKDDYVEARNLTYTLVEMTGRALQGALEVAIESQHPKAYDSFNGLAQTMRGISKDLLEFQKIYQSIIDHSKPKVANITQNNINMGGQDDGKTVEVTPQKITVKSSITEILKNLDDLDSLDIIDAEVVDGKTE